MALLNLPAGGRRTAGTGAGRGAETAKRGAGRAGKSCCELRRKYAETANGHGTDKGGGVHTALYTYLYSTCSGWEINCFERFRWAVMKVWSVRSKTMLFELFIRALDIERLEHNRVPLLTRTSVLRDTAVVFLSKLFPAPGLTVVPRVRPISPPVPL